MALKITTQIGTDKGITSEAYVRISNYQISKSGFATFNIELFQSENDASQANNLAAIQSTANNQQIGNSLYIELATFGTNESNNVDMYNRIVDLSPAQGIDIFTYGYSQLKSKLVDLFGGGNVVDC